MIPAQTVREILDITRIDEVIGDFMSLKKRGSSLIGLCPFHNEKTPSFHVSPAKNIFKCFGCAKGGDAVTFLMEHDHLNYPEALKWLAKKYNIQIQEVEITPSQKVEMDKLESMMVINRFAQQYYTEQLFISDIGRNVGLNYLKQRGYNEDTIKIFELGFAFDKSDSLIQEAKLKQHSIEILTKVGLTDTAGARDFFRNRVIFPIHNLSGKVVAFAGRVLVSNNKSPKYINSPETEIYHKSSILYGIHQARKSISELDECLLVEGYTDVISLYQGGVKNVVASSGTSLTNGQLRLIKRFTNNLTILYDGDAAGAKASSRGLDLALESDMNVKIVTFPEGEDPDSYIYKIGYQEFTNFIHRESKDYILFNAKTLFDESKNDPLLKSNNFRELLRIISKINQPEKSIFYIKSISHTFEISEDIAIIEYNKLKSAHLKQFAKDESIVKNDDSLKEKIELDELVQNSSIYRKKSILEEDIQDKISHSESSFQEKDIVRILISGGHKLLDNEQGTTIGKFLIDNIIDVLNDFENPLYQKVIHDYYHCLENNIEVNEKYFLEHKDSSIKNLAEYFLSLPDEYSPNWEDKYGIFLLSQKKPDDNFVNDSKNAILRFKLKKINKLITENQLKLKTSDAEQTLLLLKVQQHLLTIRKSITDELNTVVLK